MAAKAAGGKPSTGALFPGGDPVLRSLQAEMAPGSGPKSPVCARARVCCVGGGDPELQLRKAEDGVLGRSKGTAPRTARTLGTEGVTFDRASDLGRRGGQPACRVGGSPGVGGRGSLPRPRPRALD